MTYVYIAMATIYYIWCYVHPALDCFTTDTKLAYYIHTCKILIAIQLSMHLSHAPLIIAYPSYFITMKLT